MTAANPDDIRNTDRRLSRLLIFLIAFLAVLIVIAVVSRLHGFGAGPSTTFFDAKGIMTGPGTFLVLIGAALSALIVFVAYKKWTLQRGISNPPPDSKANEAADQIIDAWLSNDVLKRPTGMPEAADLQGSFKGRHFTIRRDTAHSVPIVNYTVEARPGSASSLRAWWLGRSRAESSAALQSTAFVTADPHFENCCGWSANNPADALTFLNQHDVTGTLHRDCFIAGRNAGIDEIGLRFDDTRITLTMRTPSLHFLQATTVLVILQDLVFLADAAEQRSSASLLAGTGTVGTENFGERREHAPLKRRSRLMDVLSCLMFIVLVLVPLAALWIAGSYYTAKALDMSAGMLCFFVPVLLMAIFVFTRPAAPELESASINDMDTVRAAALKYWEQTLRADPESAALLDTYERRAQKL